MRQSYYLAILSICLFVFPSCQEKTTQAETTQKSQSIVDKVDQAQEKVIALAESKRIVAVLDHHRMAKEVGVYTPPSISTIFSDPDINSAILSNADPLVGLDLPFKFLCYSEPDTANAQVAFTSAEFIMQRHGLSQELLSDYRKALTTINTTLDQSTLSDTDLSDVNKGYGIIQIQSDFDFANSIKRLKEIVMAQSDTKWFGEIDYQSDSKALGITINPSTLLLFGAPAPGGKAMITTPKIGVDAFCQKLLVYENNNGEVWVAFNNIPAMAELYYGNSTKPQNMINQRLRTTFEKAVKEASQ